MADLLKTALFIGLMLLLGAGVFSRYIGVELRGEGVRARLRLGLALGGVLVIAASFGSVLLVFSHLGLSANMLGEYLLYTSHGRWTLLRAALVGGLVALGLGRRLPLASERTLHLALSFALLVSVSAMSHAGTSGNRLLLFADLGHLIAAALWAGSLIPLALSPVWSKGQSKALQETMARVSVAGLLSVGLLFVTGIYASSVHLTRPAELFQTDYGFVLFCKGVLVMTVVGIAVGNRWLVLPLLPRGGAFMLRRTVRLEALFLVAILALSGILTESEPETLHREHSHGAAGLEPTESNAGP